jgi:protein phosphatase
MVARPATPSPPLVASGRTHPGRKRTENEDAIGSFVGDRLFVVADGIRVFGAGDLASSTAVTALAEFFRSFHRDPLQKWPYPVDRSVSLGANLLRVGVKVANDRLRAVARERLRSRLASTIVAMAIGDAQLAIAHSGDSRAYRIRGAAIKRLTRDHSILEEMLAARPDIGSSELASLAHRNIVTRCLGSKDDVDPSLFIDTLQPGDIYLLCSDGLWASVPDEGIASIVRAAGDDIDGACRRLVDAANDAGGPDNISVIVVRVG